MGMFDNITVSREYNLPIDEEQQRHIQDHVGVNQVWKRRFQTKDLENLLDYYEIDPNGVLWSLPMNQDRVKSDVTNTITFYDYITNDKLDTDLTIMFEALVIQGHVSHVKLTTFETDDNTERKTTRNKWFQQAELAEKRRKTWKWRLYNVLYATHVNWCLKQLHRVSQHVSHKCLTDWRRCLLFWN